MTLAQRFAVAYAVDAHATQTGIGTDLPDMSHLLRVSGNALKAAGGETLAIAGRLSYVAWG